MPGRNGLCGAIAADVPAVTILSMDTLLHSARHKGEGTENHIRFNTAIGSHAWTLLTLILTTVACVNASVWPPSSTGFKVTGELARRA